MGVLLEFDLRGSFPAEPAASFAVGLAVFESFLGHSRQSMRENYVVVLDEESLLWRHRRFVKHGRNLYA